MKKLISLFVPALILSSCGNNQPETDFTTRTIEVDQSQKHEKHHEKLKEAYQLFKEGDDEKSVELAEEVLEFGQEVQDPDLIGGALSSLCRNAQRSHDTAALALYSNQLKSLSESTGNMKWMMKRAHMNAEMWRLMGYLDRAETYYNESMEISNQIGEKGMYMIDHFNKSFVSTAKEDFQEARRLIKRYYELRKEHFPGTEEDPYGLIAIAYLLDREGNYLGAHEVAVVARRIFKEENIFPEPPDEKPLKEVEVHVKEQLTEEEYNEVVKNQQAVEIGVAEILDTHMSEK